jgi:bifunctional DNA-binding transcriptional regulator/antitoxin component of YhaV-PrlF toxin-antitoxin module
LEIRDALGIGKGDKLLLSVSSSDDKKVTIVVAKAPEGIESCACSRNGAYVKRKRGVQYD